MVSEVSTKSGATTVANSWVGGGLTSLETRVAWIAAILLSIMAAGAYALIADWPFGTHFDEIKKVSFILTGQQDFHHPILALQVSRLANIFLGFTENEEILALARSMSAIFGGLTVFSTFILGRTVLKPLTALAAAMAVSVTPLIVFHSTFLKEDIYLTAPLIFGLAALIVLIGRPSLKLAILTGLSFGLAISAKLVGLVFFFYAIALVLSLSKDHFSSRLKRSGVILATALLAFAAVNLTAFIDYETAAAGFEREFGHGLTGARDVSDVVVPIWMTGGIMHLRDSLLPGMGLPLLAVGCIGLFSPIFDQQHRRNLAIIAVGALIWYFVHEISPSKPYPNFERYMVPEGPLLVVLGAALLQVVGSRLLKPYAAMGASIAIVLCAIPAAYASYEIARASAHDPRKVVPYLLRAFGPQTRFDEYITYLVKAPRSVDPSRPLNAVFTSSFWYGRFERYGGDPAQGDHVRQLHDWYFNEAFKRPYLELSSGGPSFGFLNPVIRIVALNNNINRLVEIGEAVIEFDPHINLRLGP